MSLLTLSTWIDGRTGHKVPDPKTTPNTAATLAGSYVYATSQIPGLDGLRAGNTLVIDTEVDLSAFRLARGWDADERGYDYLYSYPELRAAFDHPHVTREKMVEGINPPERGRRLALYDALAWWLHHVETEWLLLMPGEALIGPATERIDPMLLDLYHEHPVTLRRQCNQWLRGEAAQIPESAAKEAQRCLQAALSAYAGALR